jgi:hypothetical protein
MVLRVFGAVQRRVEVAAVPVGPTALGLILLFKLRVLAELMAVVVALVVELMVVEARLEQCVLFGPALLAHSLQQIQVICNGIIYTHQKWSAI